MSLYPQFSGERRQQRIEEETLARWREREVFQKSLARRKDAPRFTFYEGPPTANGRPGIHHVLARTLKDVICRYQDLAGHLVERKAGWDTHGLPVEVEVEKSLGIHGKDAIAAYGLERFSRACVDSVFKYVSDWERLTERTGYWLDLRSAYVTYHQEYVESVWWALATLYERGLLYKSHKVVWWWPQGGTALSAQEVGYGYRAVDDPSAVVRFPVTEAPFGKRTSFLAWTTTPWTLPSNVGLAVGSEVTYVAADLGDEIVLLAEGLVATHLSGRELSIVGTFRGADLVGWRYTPPFVGPTPANGRAFEVIAAAFVTTDSGTGIVHLAPAFGEDDHRACREAGLGFLQLVKPDGTLTDEVVGFAGRFVKDADKDLLRNLKERGLLFAQSTYHHDYPFCWRALNDPLIQFARESWFVATSTRKDDLLAHNASISWHPDTIREGRFGDMLRNNVDWALSRERFWGTPLPIWINDVTGRRECIPSVAAILERNPQAFAAFDAARREDPTLSPHLRVHRPWIDGITWTQPGEAGTYRRVPDVIDCWFDSGSMPFAQRGAPHRGQTEYAKSAVADYICEGVDQTRGWFYSLHAISTLLFDRPAYRHVLVNGLVRDKQKRKMSKSLGNTVDPWDVIEAHGADPLRWYLLSGSPPWSDKNFDIDGVAEVSRKIFGTLWPSYEFFALYANVDGWTRAKSRAAPVGQRCAMDRWLTSRVQSLVRDFRLSFEEFDPMRATRLLGDFIVDELSNWYIRRNRARFWKSEDSADKDAAHATLATTLETVAVLLAPIAPMTADALYVALHPNDSGRESVHLEDLPQPIAELIDSPLEQRMGAILTLVGLGRAARKAADLRVRQPLARLVAAGPDRTLLLDAVNGELGAELREELNVKTVEIAERTVDWCKVTIKPNLPVLGPRFGRSLGALKAALGAIDSAAIERFEITGQLQVSLDGTSIALDENDVLVERTGLPGFAVAAQRGFLVALETTLTPALEREGLRREVINRVQNQRKQSGFSVSTRIVASLAGDERLLAALRGHEEAIGREILAPRVTLFDTLSELAADGASDWDVDGSTLRVKLVPTDVPS